VTGSVEGHLAPAVGGRDDQSGRTPDGCVMSLPRAVCVEFAEQGLVPDEVSIGSRWRGARDNL